jgi:hypothetical protein
MVAVVDSVSNTLEQKSSGSPKGNILVADDEYGLRTTLAGRLSLHSTP